MNTTGKKFGGRQKGTPNKLSSKIKEKLSKLIDEVIASFDIEDMRKAERLKLIQLAMPYVLTITQQLNRDVYYWLVITNKPPIAATHKIDIIHPLILSVFGLNAFLNRLSLFENR
mgnify:CR=1 FL=1